MVDSATGKTSRRKARRRTAKVIALPRGGSRPANDNGPLARAVSQIGSHIDSRTGSSGGLSGLALPGLALPGLALPGLSLAGLPLSSMTWSPALWPAAFLLSAWTSWYNFTIRPRD